jgi:hypothetical protein
VGASKAFQPFTADPPPPAPTNLSLDPSTDSGVQGDDITNVTEPKIDGEGTAGDTVTVIDGTTMVGTATVGDDGSWQVTTSTLGAGPHTLTATETDAAGNTSDPSSPLSLTIDTTPPAAPTDLTLDPTTDNGQIGDDITSFTQPKIDGQGHAGDAVTLKDGSTTVGTGMVGGDGSWSITTSDLTLGDHSLSATETDVAGNISGASAPLNLTIVSPPIGPTGPNQFFYSGNNNQFVVGTGGDDSIWINSGGNVVDGLGGDDFLGGSGDGNTYDGGDGNDTVIAIGNDNTVLGGSGNDLIELAGNKCRRRRRKRYDLGLGRRQHDLRWRRRR